jgi:pyrroline-5-carboxylate reductase
MQSSRRRRRSSGLDRLFEEKRDLVLEFCTNVCILSSTFTNSLYDIYLTAMPYTLCVLGCGTMGVAVTSGVLSTVADIRASLNSPAATTSVVEASSAGQSARQGDAIPSPDSSQMFDNDLETLPDAYIATVHRQESARRLTKTFKTMPGGSAVKVQAGNNVEAVKQADVILLW